MSDRELEEYIRKIDAKFDSHIEKGTIEMSNEYYNLVEERMARLIDKNQQLKEVIAIKEKQLEEVKNNKTDYTKVNILEMKLDKYKEIKIRQWADYEGEQIQIISKDGNTYLMSMNNCTLIKE